MKLVDIDALDEEMYRKSFMVDDGRNRWDSGLWIRYKIWEEARDEAPATEAIPLRWIENWWDEHIKYANDGDDVAVDEMLKDWRKENEQIRNSD